MCGDQPKKDLYPLLELLREYTGLLGTYPEIVNVHKGALTKLKECQKLQEDDKLQYSEVAGVSQRMDSISSATFAEIEHFQTQRCKDFKNTTTHYLKEQVLFHQEIIKKLNSSIAMFEQVPD
jgi:sorting nexin-9/18/33